MWFSITTLGCKVNQYDGEAIAARLETLGLRRLLRPAPDRTPDLLVINTCCVTATAMRKSRQAIRRALRQAPGAAVLVAGCYGDYDPARIAGLLAEMGLPPGRAAVVGHHDDLAARIEQFVRSLRRPAASPPAPAPAPGGPRTLRRRRLAAARADAPGPAGLEGPERFPARQRAFVKVQDGCDAFCSYCVVPYTRPVVRSRPVESILAQCRRLVDAGHREIVLCGVFLGAFGRTTAVRRRWDDRPPVLPGLLRKVCEIPGLWRARLSSIEPGDVTDELLDVVASCPAAAPHFHMPLQSGSPDILRRMNRQYTAGQFRRTVERIRAALDRPALTTDIIVGFPGETDRDFAATLELARAAGFAKIHAFPFSPVEPTAAWRRRREAPPAAVVRDRLARLVRLERDLAETYRRQFLGQRLEALVEAPRPAAPLRRAMTDRYLPVEFPPPPRTNPRRLTGRVVHLRVAATTPEGLRGELLPEPT